MSHIKVDISAMPLFQQKNVPKTLKQEKARRNTICRENYGDDWEWESEPDFYQRYRVLANLRQQKPFKLSQCRRFDSEKVTKDIMKRYYKEVNNKHQCDIVDGHWEEKAIHRYNLLDEGICWVREDDKYCSVKHNNNDLIKYKSRGEKGFIWPSSLRKSQDGCVLDKRCSWDAKTYDCISQEAMDDVGETLIPELPSTWPTDVTRTNIQEYLKKYYLRLLDESPQSYMPIFGKGNRCIGYQRMKISQPQTVVNMVFKGMAERGSKTGNRGMLIWHGTGSGKCFRKGTKILMHDGSIKEVQDIHPGEYVMGDDSTARTVLSLGTGTDEMYKISCQYPGYDFVVNSEHVLCLKWIGDINTANDWDKSGLPGKMNLDGVLHIEVKDYIGLQDDIKSYLKGYVLSVHYPKQMTRIDPFIYGQRTLAGIAPCYLNNSFDIRMSVLSGILSSWLIGQNEIKDTGPIEIDTSMFTREMINDVIRLARSCGLIAYESPIASQSTIILLTEQINSTLDIDVESVGIEDYYGFTLDGNHRFLLDTCIVTHNTCTAAGVMEAFWDTNKEIIFTSSVEALASNPPEAFMDCAKNLFPRFKQEQFKDNLPAIKEEFQRRNVRFFTFAQLAHYLLISHPLKVKKEDEEKHKNLLSNAILIIDEVHNIFKPLPHQKDEHFALRDFLMDYNNPYTRNLNIAILTATPGDSAQEIVDLLNMVRDRRAPPIKVPGENYGEFAKSINGLISYFNIASDLSKYPLIKKQEPHKAPMSMIQYRRYTEAFDEVSTEDKDFEKLQKTDRLDRYYKTLRKYSNTLFNWEKGMLIEEFSSKIPLLIEQIRKYPNEKHYVYSTFFENRGFGGHGILAIAKILEKELKYEKLPCDKARSLNNKDGPLGSKLTHKRRYMLAITNELSTDKKHSVGENLQEMVKLFNNPQNKNGEYIHVFLASQKFNEGVDFKAVRHVHILEPFLTNNKELQTIGRGARYCSHRDLDINNDEWIVNVHKYIADFPIELKSFDIDSIKSRVETLKENIAAEDAKLFAIKGQRGKEFTDIRENAKKEVTKLRSELVLVSKQLKEASSLDPKKYFMIDQKIEDEVRERIKAQMYLLLVMKMMALDCELFRDFHKQSGDTYSCANPLSDKKR